MLSLKHIIRNIMTSKVYVLMIKAECKTLHLMLTMFKKICNIIKIIRDKGKIGERIIECHNVVHEIYDNTEFCSRP